MGITASTRRFEYKDKKSSKFWEVSVEGNGFTVRYGKIGTDGRTQDKDFADAATAKQQAQKLVAEKVVKGYVEVGSADISITVADISEGTVPQAEIPLQALPGNIAAKKTPTKHRKVRSASALAKDPTTESARLELLLGKTKSISSLLVKHPNASAALLEKLSHSFDSTIRQQVVLHANTSKDVLLRLASIFPKDIIRSPVFDRLLIEESDQLLTRIGGWLATILERHDCPLSLMTWVVKHGSRYERSVVSKNPIAPVELLNYLAANDGEIGLCGPISFEQAKAILLVEIKSQIKSDNNIGSYRYWYKEYAWSPDHPFEVRQAIMFRENDARSLVLEILKVDFEIIISRCNAEQLEKIIDDHNWDTDKLVIPALINHPELTKGMLTKILDKRIGWPGYEEDDLHQECKRAILGHHFCPVEYIKWNSDDDYWGTIASNSSIKLEWLEKYVTENSCWLHAVRGGENLALGAAENPNCSAKLLQSIINWRWGEDCEPCDANGRVRLAIINHPNCSDKLKKLLIEELCNSGDDYLILKLLSVHGLPDSMQEKAVEEIQKSKNINILLRFASMPFCPEELRYKLLLKHASNHEYCELISNILSNYPDDNLWREAVEMLLATGGMNSLMAVADSYIRSKDIFDRVVLDAPDEVRRKLAANSSCPLNVIEKLINDTNPIIQLIAACNANASYGLWLNYAFPYLVEPVSNWPIVKWSLANDLSGAENFDLFERDLYLPEKYANVIMKDGPRPLRLLALLGNGVTKQQLLCYGKSMGSEDSWMFRSVVALNKATDIEILNSLANDEDLIVKTLALAAIDARAIALEQHS